jgi:hypothetical protein
LGREGIEAAHEKEDSILKRLGLSKKRNK